MNAHTDITATFAPRAASTTASGSRSLISAQLALIEWRLSDLDRFLDAIGDAEETEASEAIHDEQSALIERALAAEVETADERAAQVRILLRHVMPAKWRGPDAVLDWEVAMARRLLCKFAGLDPMVDPLSA